MIGLLRNKVAEYVTQSANVSSWESVRELYGMYTYLAFLCIATNDLTPVISLEDVIRQAKNKALEIQPILEELLKLKSADVFVKDILGLLYLQENLDIERIYQEYLSVDFTIKDNKVVFENGKNGRDVLGSYYTQKEFAETITKKIFEDFESYNRGVKKIKVVDYSCGGSIFLLAALRICVERGFSADFYGYDVDPIAVLISRLKTGPYAENKGIRINILMGNPLLPRKGNCVEKFKKAISGRYYNKYMGIDVVQEVDIVLGNPPWEKVRFEEKKFLHHFLPTSDAGTKSEREKILKTVDRKNVEYYQSLLGDYEECKRYFKASRLFEQSNSGEINTYALFTELSRKMLRKQGFAGLIVKSSLVKMPVYKSFFKDLTLQGELYDIYMFTNRNKIFNIDSREEFSVIFLSKGLSKGLNVTLNLTDYNDLDTCEKVSLSYEELSLINPETGMLPNIKDAKDLRFLLAISKRCAVFGEVYTTCRYGRLVHFTNHSKYISKFDKEGYVPIYEGKFIELFTGKYASFHGMDDKEKYKNKASAKAITNPQGSEYPESRFYIENNVWENMSKNFNKEYIIAWRSLTSATNRRTMLATILPLLPTCQSIQFLQLDDKRQMLHVLALFNSIVFDYIVRLKMVGLDLTQTIIKQIPVPRIEQYDDIITFKGIETSVSSHILSRLKKLYSDDIRLKELFLEYETYDVCGDRKSIIADNDHLIGYLYGIEEGVLKSIASSFDAFYTKEDVATYFG